MFNRYPTPFPDEHLASVMFRAFLLTYYAEIENHFKVRHNQLFFDTPINFWVPAFWHLVNYFGAAQPADSLLKQHSNVMDYNIWAASVNGEISLSERLALIGKSNWKLSLHIDTDRGWRYCPACGNEDLKLHGASYWHVSHQRYYQRTCSKHNTVLKTLPSAKFSLPPVGETAVSASAEECKLDKQLANVVGALRQLPHQERKKRVIYVLNQKLNISQNVTSRHSYNGQRLSQLHSMLADAINTPDILPFFTFDKAVPKQAPFTSMTGLYHMLNENNQMHPLWYLILIHAFLDEEDMLIAFDPMTDLGYVRRDIEANIMPMVA